MSTPAIDSLERLVPETLDPRDDTGQATLALHLERYRFAASKLRPGRVLDLACGVGYGSAILAERTGVTVVGVDVAQDAIAWARARHARANVEYRVGDGLAFEDEAGFDAIVSLETVEHVEDPGRLVAKLASLLRPKGVLIASVPTTPSVDLNPHHRHDFSEGSFRRLVAERAPGLRERDSLRQVQPVSPLRVLARSEKRMADLRPSLPAYYAAHPGALVRRLVSTLRFGFTNRYLTLVCERSEDGKA